MCVRKIDDKWYVDIRHQGSRYRKKSPEDSKKGALAYEQLLLRRIGKTGLIESEKKECMLFEEFASYWFKTYVVVNNKPTTIRSKRNDLEDHLYPIIGNLPLDEIDQTKVELIKAKKIKEGLAPKTINGILTTLSICLRTAEEWKYVEKVPRMRWLKVPDQTFDFLNDEECTMLINNADDELVRDMLLCAMRTGMRRGELLGLEWRAIDFIAGRITVQQSYVEGHMESTKNNRIRYIPMTLELHSALAGRKQADGFVFSHCLNSKEPIESIWASKAIVRTCNKVGLRRIGWHTLRHTFASQLIMKGVPMRAVQVLLGHSTIQMTERYSHLAPSALHEAIAVLEQPKNTKTNNFGQYVGSGLQIMPALRIADGG